MKRSELAHILRAAAEIAGEGHILVVGSQAILASHAEHELPDRVTLSVEADVAFLDGDLDKSDQVDGAIGEGSKFHQTFGYYAQGVGLETAVLPMGWRDRALRFDQGDLGQSEAICPEVHDLALSKLYAGREKDYEYVAALLEAKVLDATVMLDRARLLPVLPGAIRRVTERVERMASRYQL